MSAKLIFAGQHYLSLLLFVTTFWGLGSAAMRWGARVRCSDPWLGHALAITVGMGMTTVALLGLAAGGDLRRANINIVLIVGCALALAQIALAARHRLAASPTSSPPNRWLYAVLPLALALPTVLSVLHPPYKWDELMYHLPHAQQWVQTGHLQVNEWLRYPWAPYNLGLLYAAGLIVRGDVFPHLLHALAGWLVAVMVFRFGLQHGGRAVACIATVFWLLLTRGEYDSALVDMGVSVFIFGACVAHLQWLEQRHAIGWLALSGLLLGCAAGSKYQALGLLPFFLVSLLAYQRRPTHLLVWATAVAIPCMYWYVRNLLMTGDPFNPLGGRIFGYHDWNAEDMAYQLYDLKRSANWPKPFLWFAALAPLFANLRASPSRRSLQAFACYGFVVWLLTSHYDRYLMPIYPVLAVLSAYVLVYSALAMADRWAPAALRAPAWRRTMTGFGIVLVVGLSLKFVVGDTRRYWNEIATNADERTRLLSHRAWSYGLAETLKGHNIGKAYQWGLEGSIYYLPHPVYGDHFGPWRYRDMAGLSPQQLAQKLQAQQFTALLAQAGTAAHLEAQPDFFRYFSLIVESNGDKAYLILPSPHETQH